MRVVVEMHDAAGRQRRLEVIDLDGLRRVLETFGDLKPVLVFEAEVGATTRWALTPPD